MTTRTKIALALATLLPGVYFIFFIAVVVSLVYYAAVTRGSPPQSLIDRFWMMMLLHVLTTIWTVGLSIIYTLNIFRNDRVTPDRKPLWAVAIFLGHSVAMPIYWYRYIWPQDTRPAPGRSARFGNRPLKRGNPAGDT